MSVENLIYSTYANTIGKAVNEEYANMPTVPLPTLRELEECIENVGTRDKQVNVGKSNLTTTYKIGGHRAVGYQFMYGDGNAEILRKSKESVFEALRDHSALVSVLEKFYDPKDDAVVNKLEHLMHLSLDDPRQFTMGWQSLTGLNKDGEKFVDDWAGAITDVDTANRVFWRTIADYGLSYNLINVEKLIKSERLDKIKALFGSNWLDEFDKWSTQGELFCIDYTIFATVTPSDMDGTTRFTPASCILLRQDLHTKEMMPIAAYVSGHQGENAQVYLNSALYGTTTPSAWLYALQAVKTSMTTYGIWLGHVYQWHLGTAALQMTFKQTVSKDHVLSQMLLPMFEHVIAFDALLLLLWREMAPPTSIASGREFLELCDTFAENRGFHDDDPAETMRRNNIDASDFTSKKADGAWDKYPTVQSTMAIWALVEKYVTAVVEDHYPDDAAVAADADLQLWVKEAKNPEGGNIRGLDNQTSRAALVKFLTSIVYRITIHGSARLERPVYPALTFVGNFPPCLHKSDIPSPTDTLSTKQLLEYMPNTGTIGYLCHFIGFFVFTPPYTSMVPYGGVDADLFFGDNPDDPKNKALIDMRSNVIAYIHDVQPEKNQIFQWPLNIES